MVGGKNKLSSIFYSCITYFVGEITFCTFNCTDKTIPILLSSAPNYFVYAASLKGKFSSGIEGALASTLNHDFNWKQLSEMILCIFLLMFSKFI